MNDDFIENIASELESTAQWRREKATEYPNDRRNNTAADILDGLAEAIRAEPRSDAAMRLQELDEEIVHRSETDKNFDSSPAIMESGDYRRRIGFSEFPRSPAEYLETLAAIYRNQVASTRKSGLRQGAAEIQRLRRAAADLRSKVSQGSYGDAELQSFWELTQSAGLILRISNPELGARAGLGDDFFMSVSRDQRRPKLANFLKALSAIIEVADERLAVIAGTVRSPNRDSRKGRGADSRIEQDRDELSVLASTLSKLALDEIKKLEDELPNDPSTIERNRKHRELLQIFADGFARIADALAALGTKQPEPGLVSKAIDVVKSVGTEVNDWFAKNGSEAVDWGVRISFLTAGIAALGWAGADMRIATTVISTIVGGKKVIDILRRPKKGPPKR